MNDWCEIVWLMDVEYKVLMIEHFVTLESVISLFWPKA